MSEVPSGTSSVIPQAHVVKNTGSVQSKEQQLAREFEAVFLAQFVDEMMKTVDSVGPASGGFGAEMWRSQLSKALADSLAERGGLGLSASIERAITAYRG